MNEKLHAECSIILNKIRFKDGRSRNWIAKDSGVNKLYVSFATSQTKRRRNGKEKNSYLCPLSDVVKLINWAKENGYEK